MLRRHCRAIHLFLTGLLILPAFLLQSRIDIRIAQTTLYGIMAWIAGKRVRWLYFILLICSVTLFNLLAPNGEVLLRVGPLDLTEGALRLGLSKGFGLVGLVFISLFSVRPDLRLPGWIGGLLTDMFWHFERILQLRKQVRLRRFIADIDVLLNRLYPPGAPGDVLKPPEGIRRTTPIGWVLLGLLLGANWALVALT